MFFTLRSILNIDYQLCVGVASASSMKKIPFMYSQLLAYYMPRHALLIQLQYNFERSSCPLHARNCNVLNHHCFVLACSNLLIVLCIIWHLWSLFPILEQNLFSTLYQDISILQRLCNETLCLKECFLFCIYCCLWTKLKCYSSFLLKVGERCWMERSIWKVRIMKRKMWESS